MPTSHPILRALLLSLRDLYFGLDRVLARHGGRGLAFVLVALVAGFWAYVPLHELGHAVSCLLAGGEVSRLEVSPLFGGALLARWIPWVEAGGDYAGRLSGFSTGGSDLVYLATDLGPFLLTFPGVWLLRRGARAASPWLYGGALAFAMAPFLSLSGDAYEIGSILVTRVGPWSSLAASSLLRGDDLLLKAGQLGGEPPALWIGFALAALVGALWAWATYALAGRLAGALGQPPIEPAPLPSPGSSPAPSTS
jgi:hypothetical protein